MNWGQKQQFELGMQGSAIVFDNAEGKFPSSDIKPNIWYHGAATFQAGSQIVYLNGELVKSSADLQLPEEDRTNELRIGGSFAGPRDFEGIIDEVRIWNRVLGPEEIQDNMNLSFSDLLAVSPDGRLTTTWGRIKTRFK